MPKKICFVIGPIGEAGTQIRADADDFMEYVVSPCPALEEYGYGKPVRADHLSEPGRITSQIIKLLMDADLVIADLTGSNSNVYYELSLRHALGKPVIHMAMIGTRLSFDVQDNRTIFYSMHSRVAEEARNALAEQIRNVHREGYKATNPITETAGLIRLEQSGDPRQEGIAQVMRMIEGLSAQIAQQNLPQSLRVALGETTPPGLWGLADLGRTNYVEPIKPFLGIGLGQTISHIDAVRRARDETKKDEDKH